MVALIAPGVGRAPAYLRFNFFSRSHFCDNRSEFENRSGVPAGSLLRELKSFSGAGLLLRQPVANVVRYKANKSYLSYLELAADFEATVKNEFDKMINHFVEEKD